MLLKTAGEAIKQAIDFADTDQLDKAYVEYLRASEITINTIPHHADYRDTVNQRPAWYKEFADLMMVRRAFICFLYLLLLSEVLLFPYSTSCNLWRL